MQALQKVIDGCLTRNTRAGRRPAGRLRLSHCCSWAAYRAKEGERQSSRRAGAIAGVDSRPPGTARLPRRRARACPTLRARRLRVGGRHHAAGRLVRPPRPAAPIAAVGRRRHGLPRGLHVLQIFRLRPVGGLCVDKRSVSANGRQIQAATDIRLPQGSFLSGPQEIGSLGLHLEASWAPFSGLHVRARERDSWDD